MKNLEWTVSSHQKGTENVLYVFDERKQGSESIKGVRRLFNWETFISLISND